MKWWVKLFTWTYYTCLLQEVVRSKYKCTIVESSSVQEIIPKAKTKLIDRDEAENFCMLVCRGGKTYECRKIVLCAGPWTNNIMEKLSWVSLCIIDQPQIISLLLLFDLSCIIYMVYSIQVETTFGACKNQCVLF